MSASGFLYHVVARVWGPVKSKKILETGTISASLSWLNKYYFWASFMKESWRSVENLGSVEDLGSVEKAGKSRDEIKAIKQNHCDLRWKFSPFLHDHFGMNEYYLNRWFTFLFCSGYYLIFICCMIDSWECHLTSNFCKINTIFLIHVRQRSCCGVFQVLIVTMQCNMRWGSDLGLLAFEDKEESECFIFLLLIWPRSSRETYPYLRHKVFSTSLYTLYSSLQKTAECVTH